MRTFRRIVIILFFIVLFLAGIGIILFQINEDKIKKQLLTELNEELTTLVDVNEITFNFFRHFPNITANFKQVTVYSPEEFNSKYSNKVSIDTLLNVSNIYFEINSLGLIQKKIVFNKIILNDGWLNIILNEKGENNYQVFKIPEKNGSDGLSLNFKSVEFRNILFDYFDIEKRLQIKSSIDEQKAIIKNNHSSIKFHTKISILELISKEALVLSNKALSVSLDLSIKDDVFTITNGDLDFAGVSTMVSGTLQKKESLFLDCSIASTGNKVKNLLQLIPEDIQDKFKALKVAGNLSLNGTIKGFLGDNKYPHINLQFNLKQGLFFYPKSNLRFADITASGDLDNGSKNNTSTTLLRINSFQSRVGGETINGTYQIKNLENPEIKITTSGTFNLKEFIKLTPNTDAEILDGYARVNMTITGKLREFRKISLNDLEKFNPKGQVELINVTYKTFKRPIVFSSVSGIVRLGERFHLDSLHLKINDNPITIHGKAENVLSYLNQKRKPLVITGNVETPGFDLTSIIPGRHKTSPGNTPVRTIHLPEHMEAHIKLNAKALSYRRFKTENFTCFLLYNPGSLLLDDVNFSSMDGKTNGNITIFEQADSVLQMHALARIDNIDIHKLFYQMGNFGQTFIKYDNLEGNVSGNIKFYSKWSNDLRIDKKSIIAESKYVIENGELINFEPIQKLSRFIAVDELKDINFSRLQNDVFIKNETVTMPLMEINTSAFNIEASGNHYFNKRYEYNVRVLLSDILASKAKNKKKENNEFGIVEDDGLGKTTIPLKIIGDPEDINVSYDGKGMTRNIKADLKNERQNLKQLFSKEFRERNTDSTSLSDKKETKKFNITWEEEEVPDTTIKK
ncbi:MAG: AsmA-like C-terminal region-containing protein [Bacteroidales bacterium]|nr:AsmA-like C-terminal region-containing protein [Bacteroidales bacterium]